MRPVIEVGVTKQLQVEVVRFAFSFFRSSCQYPLQIQLVHFETSLPPIILHASRSDKIIQLVFRGAGMPH